ncbi:MAG: 50S ribosomal protein L29 [Marinifilaceae bacterium]|jgi:large subunit ribosomal protein L29|nr:50S ribosomal protein L29 [Marinifilaceae bacterium]
MKTSEIKELTTNELIERVETAKADLTRMKMNHAVSPMENPMAIRALRRDISRMLTLLRQRQLTEK